MRMRFAVDAVLCAAVVAQVWRNGLLPAVYGVAVAGECWQMWQQHVYMDRHHANACKPDIVACGNLNRMHI